MQVFGLIGFPLTHSFSKKYFGDKFVKLGLTKSCRYENFELDSIISIISLLENNQEIAGLNVTIPYKEKIIPFLTEMDITSQEIGAVNTIKIVRDAKGKPVHLTGYNTDVIGFNKSLSPLLKPFHSSALILGTGGASKAVAFVLNSKNIPYKFVSRNPIDSFSGLLLSIFILLPLLFIHLNNKHDWGDDFAQYLLQANWLTNETPELLVSETDSYGPSIKGIVFSIVLIPAVLSEKNELFFAKATVILSLIFLGIMLFKGLNTNCSKMASIFLTCFFAYNFHVLHLKDQVLPDFLFTALILLIALCFSKQTRKFTFLAFVLILLSIGIRSAGIAVLVAGIIFIFQIHFAKGFNFLVKWYLWVLPISIVIVLLGNWLFLDAIGIRWYLELITKSATLQTSMANLFNYKNGFIFFFEQEVPMWLNSAIRILIFPAMVLGFLHTLLKKPGFLEWFVLSYILLLFIYPYHNEPIRFLIPLIVIGLIYLAHFYSFLLNLVAPKYATYTLTAFAFILVLTNFKSTTTYIKSELNYSTSSTSSKELFQFVKNKIPQNDKVAFYKLLGFILFYRSFLCTISQ
ncbi:MAG: hypothetical protein IPP71_14855 [Bacteroidetes bacterium]|nr:hypothetical protein [Bacteroidota bacterium]